MISEKSMSRIRQHVSVGNRKIGRDTAIFNITPAATCPADKLGLCEISAKCYAKKAERLYPQVLPYRERQTEIWDKYTFKQIADAIGTKSKRLKYFRLNESGDFRSQDDIVKFHAVATHLWNKYRIKSYCYTARRDLALTKDSRAGEYLTFTTSGYQQAGFNSFYPVKEFSGENLECRGDCSRCNLCKFNHGEKIEVIIH